MSEHKTVNTTFDKKSYWAERKLTSQARRAKKVVKSADMDELNPKTGERKYSEKIGIGRRRNRQRIKNRQGSTKGMAKVMFMDEGQATSKFVQAGGKIHQQAISNSRAFRKGARGE